MGQIGLTDWQYPVITAHHATREDRLYRTPNVLSASTNRNVLQPTEVGEQRRKRRIAELQNAPDKGKHRKQSHETSSSSDARGLLQSGRERSRSAASSSSSGSSGKSESSQRVDLVVEDEEAEEIERVRARKSGNPRWNNKETRHFVRAYPEGGGGQTSQLEQANEGAHVGAMRRSGSATWEEQQPRYEDQGNVWDDAGGRDSPGR